ncbi:MAG TPA: bacillithiol biosynthesis BshC [Planctomycetota bacterium]|nr:bacillithiol biosynthesis BshC [Planctomycetota bacterium]
MKIELVGYEKLRTHYPGLFISYCLDEPRAVRLFAHRYRDEKAIVERAQRAAEKGVEKSLIETLKRYHDQHGAPPDCFSAIEKLEEGAAAVVTGQQPSVGWGPLYNFHKAQAAIRFAQGIEARGVPCVAIFWNHSDDTRGGDVVSFPDRENQVKDIPLPPGEPGRPLYEQGSPEALRLFAGALADALPSTEFSPWLTDLIRLTHVGNVAESFTKLLLNSFGHYGLIVLEPRHLEGERSAKFFAEHLANPERLSKAVDAGRRAVIAEQFEDHLGREIGLDVFEMREGRRVRLEKPGPAKGRLSAGVVLRPLLQDAVLPTCAYVGGPSEVGYQAELLPAYRAFGIEPPVVFPRVTATLLEPKIWKIRERVGLTADRLFESEAALGPLFLRQEEDVAGELEKLPDRLMSEVGELMKRLQGAPAMSKAQDKTALKVREALEALASRVRDEQSRQDTTGRGLLSKLMTHLRPGGKMQERVFTPLYHASLFGPTFFQKLLGTLDPFVFSHQVITVL